MLLLPLFLPSFTFLLDFFLFLPCNDNTLHSWGIYAVSNVDVLLILSHLYVRYSVFLDATLVFMRFKASSEPREFMHFNQLGNQSIHENMRSMTLCICLEVSCWVLVIYRKL